MGDWPSRSTIHRCPLRWTSRWSSSGANSASSSSPRPRPSGSPTTRRLPKACRRRPMPVRTRDGKARYPWRKATVETVFGIIKQSQGQPLNSCCAACMRCRASAHRCVWGGISSALLRLKDEKEVKIGRFHERYRYFRCFARRRISHVCQCRLSVPNPKPKSDRLLALDRLLGGCGQERIRRAAFCCIVRFLITRSMACGFCPNG